MLTETKLRALMSNRLSGCNLSPGSLKRLYDGRGEGLYVLARMSPKGKVTLVFRWDYRSPVTGKRTVLTFGRYPLISLKEAREALAKAKRQVAKGQCPNAEKKKKVLGGLIFKVIAEQYLNKLEQENKLSKKTIQLKRSRLKRYVFPFFGDKPISAVTHTDIIETILKIQYEGHIEAGLRTKQVVSQVFQYAIDTGIVDINPVHKIGPQALLKPQKRHYRAIKDAKRLGELWAVLTSENALLEIGFIVQSALNFTLLTACRANEYRFATWKEIDWEDKLWRVPVERMKPSHIKRSGLPHLVPLARQTIELLHNVQKITGHDPNNFIFTVRGSGNPLSDNTLNKALKRLGFHKDTVQHGFRQSFSTFANEAGWPYPAIEVQLSHQVGSEVARAYNHAQYLDQRRDLMQWWADYLDNLAKKYGNANS